MGWGVRMFAVLVGLVTLTLGAWPISLLAFGYVAYSFRANKPPRSASGPDLLHGPRRPWRRLVLGGVLLLFSGVALVEGGTFSPAVFFLAGAVTVASPLIGMSGLACQVVPVNDSILLRNRVFPFRWHALAEVKLEAQDQARGVASMDGQLLVFAGKSPCALQVMSVLALAHEGAEDKVVRNLRRETRMLSQRGAHLLPLDSVDAHDRLSLKLRRIKIGTGDFGAVSSLPFDIITIQAREGLVVRHRAFRVEAPGGSASIPAADISPERRPLLAEVVEEISEKHGWPAPDEFSPFLATLDASRAEPLADRLRTGGVDGGRLTVETPGGAEVKLTRPQLRAVARIYA